MSDGFTYILLHTEREAKDAFFVKGTKNEKETAAVYDVARALRRSGRV
jgi:hypothetical protein